MAYISPREHVKVLDSYLVSHKNGKKSIIFLFYETEIA